MSGAGPHAVLFDLDGTLVDSLADLAAAMNGALRRLGLPEHPEASYRYFVGDGAEILARRALPADRLDDSTLSACLAAFRELYLESWDRQTRPYDGIPELVAALARRPLKLGVVSNKPEEMTRLLVARFFPGSPFAEVRGARPGVPKKPDPAPALAAAAALAVVPARTVWLGDTSTDMQTARAAGMRPVGALWGFRPASELREHGAEALIGRPEELVGLLEAWGLR